MELVGGPADLEQGADPIDQRADADRRRDAGAGDRQRLDVAAAEREAPDRDAIGIDLVAVANVGEGGTPVLSLPRRAHQRPRLAAAVAEVPVVEGEDREFGGGEALGEGVEPLPTHAGEARRHHHTGRRPGGADRPVEPGRALLPARGEADLLPIHVPILDRPRPAAP